MAPLTSKQRKRLRSMAHELDPVLIIGKGNVTRAVADQANEALEARELIKCEVLETSELTAREACDELCERVHAEGVQVIGRRFSIYRRSLRKDVHHININ